MALGEGAVVDPEAVSGVDGVTGSGVGVGDGAGALGVSSAEMLYRQPLSLALPVSDEPMLARDTTEVGGHWLAGVSYHHDVVYPDPPPPTQVNRTPLPPLRCSTHDANKSPCRTLMLVE